MDKGLTLEKVASIYEALGLESEEYAGGHERFSLGNKRVLEIEFPEAALAPDMHHLWGMQSIFAMESEELNDGTKGVYIWADFINNPGNWKSQGTRRYDVEPLLELYRDVRRHNQSEIEKIGIKFGLVG